MLNEISQSQKDKRYLAPPFVKFGIVKFIEVGQWLSGARGSRTRKVLVKGYRVPVILGGLLHSNVHVVGKTLLYTWKLLRS